MRRVVGSMIGVERVHNDGIAFGLLGNLGVLVTLVTAAAVAAITFAFLRSADPDWSTVLGTALLLGGAVGNLIDRLRFGYVTDFVTIGRWPTFNVADAAITIGTGILLMTSLFKSPPTPVQSRADRALVVDERRA